MTKLSRLALGLLCLGLSPLFAQEFEKVPCSYKDSTYLYINDGDSDSLFYYQLIPEQKPQACIIIIPASGEKVESVIPQLKIPQAAAKKGIMTLVPSINWGTVDRLSEAAFLDTLITNCMKEYDIPADKFVLGGLSNGGVIALRYAQLAAMDSSNTLIQPAAIFGVDPPLDLARLYNYCERELERGISEVGIAEARWIKNYYGTNFGGSPAEAPQTYQYFSIYSYGADKGANAELLLETPLRFYTDLDLDYLLNKRHRDLYDWNGSDIVAMVNELKMQGHPNVEVKISMGKGLRPNGEQHPHSWSIIDNDDLMNWLTSILKL